MYGVTWVSKLALILWEENKLKNMSGSWEAKEMKY